MSSGVLKPRLDMANSLGDADCKSEAGKACYARARHNNLQRYFFYQNDQVTSWVPFCCNSLTSFSDKTLESIWCEQEHGPISSLP